MKRTAFCLFVLAMLSLILIGCSNPQPKEADLTQVMSAMKQKIGNTQMMSLSSADLMPNYGISPEDVRQFAAYVDSTGTKGDEILLFQGTDSQAADRIEKKLDSRYSQKEIEMKDYLPEEYAMLRKCGVERTGTYVSLIVSPQKDDLEKIYRSAVQ